MRNGWEQQVGLGLEPGGGQGSFDEIASESASPHSSAVIQPRAAGKAATASGFAPGAQVRVRDEQWLVRKVVPTARDGWMLEVTGVSAFVRGTDAVFYEALDDIEVLEPKRTRLVPDDSPNHRKARLYLEAVIRKTALPQTEHGLALADSFLMDRQDHQLRPAELALSMRNPQPRILIADVVGLGKTLEIGILLAELIRRGRGERILVVTPAHVLEQFQRELWTRFSIPLVRLDSTGIQRIQQDIPAGRNPFEYFKRAIISVDTLKSDVYAHHLEVTDWDAIVIDESHNLLNKGTLNNQLARTLARRTDALVLASATPHNGNAESFAELIRMLDEAAIANPRNYDVQNLDHLYIRRTKTDPEVRDSLKGHWADRGPSLPVAARATAAEDAVLAELAERWIPRDSEVVSVCADPLVAWNLFKAFLSSHKALQESIASRRKYLATADARSAERIARLEAGSDKRAKAETDAASRKPALQREREAIVELERLADAVSDDDSAKLDTLVNELQRLGVGPKSATRVVVFSERIATLKWLAEAVPSRLGFKKNTAKLEASDKDAKPWLGYGGAVQVMHGEATSDDEVRAIVEQFGLEQAPVRLLLTGDIASEGVNLHHQCHYLVHYDLPWSLIRIEQRNGRIDRYGQQYSPEFRALVLTTDAVEWRQDEKTGEARHLDDRLIGEKLLRREEEAHRIEGSVEAVTGLYRASEEENRLTRDLIAGRTVEQSLNQSHQESQAGGSRVLGRLMGNLAARKSLASVAASPSPDSEAHPARTLSRPAGASRSDIAYARVPALFPTTRAYFDEALRLICPTGPENELALRRDDDKKTGGQTISFEPPPDLQYRFKALPKSYLTEQNILPTAKGRGRLSVTFDKQLGEAQLEAARSSDRTQWPTVGFASDVHPVLEWVTDKALASLRYDEAFVLAFQPDLEAARRLGDDIGAPDLPGLLSGPVYLVQGLYSNALGRPTVVEWMAVMGLPGRAQVVRMDDRLLAACGVGPAMPGRAVPRDREGLQAHVSQAVEEATRFLKLRQSEYAEIVDTVLAPYAKRVEQWQQDALFGAARASEKAKRSVQETAADRRGLIKSLKTSGEPMLRLLGVLEPLSAAVGATAGENAR